MNIAFLTSGHYPFDDRIFYHMAKSLSAHNNNVEIVSSKVALCQVVDGIKLNCFAGDDLTKSDKISHFTRRLTEFKPVIIICSEPLTIIAAKRYKQKNNRKARIIYDITEWYPSLENLSAITGLKKYVKFLELLLLNIFSSILVDAFIFGEWYKSLPYRLLFLFKKYIYITYFPDLSYLETIPANLNGNRLNLVFTGKICINKGFGNFMKVVIGLSQIHPNLKIIVRIIGWYESDFDKNICEAFLKNLRNNITYSIIGRENFLGFIDQLRKSDIFLDLRVCNFENRYSLPIKLFYYTALAKPIIFSDLKAISREIDINKFGFLVNPDNTEQIIKIISEYLINDDLYLEHCRNGRIMAEKEFNWQKILPDLLQFIDSYSPKK